MKYYYEISLPSVPLELTQHIDFNDAENIAVVIDSNPVNYGHVYPSSTGQPMKVCRYRFGTILNTQLINWLSTNLPNSSSLRFMALESSHGIFPPHIDGRPWALNYIIHTGGDDVKTQWYQQHGHAVQRQQKKSGHQINPDCSHIWWHNMNLLDQVTAQPGQWYLIHTDVLHGVTDIPGCRRGISISASQQWAHHLLSQQGIVY